MINYGEPWTIEAAGWMAFVHASNGTSITGHEPLIGEKAARIVACVNACRHLPTDFLQSLGDNGLDAVGLTLAQQYVPRRQLVIHDGAAEERPL